MSLRASQEAVLSMFSSPQSCPDFLQCWPRTGGSYHRSECIGHSNRKATGAGDFRIVSMG